MKVVFVVGPTASGKSALAIQLAEKFHGAIVNCDSIQLYQSVNVGSAKPSSDDFRRVPHFLFDIVPEGKEITAGEYQREFFDCLKTLEKQFPVVFVVGGTGFYFQAIEKGMFNIGAADEAMQAQVESELAEKGGPEKLHEELNEKDPETAQKISVNDHYRLGRAVEILRTHGKAPSQVKKEFEDQIEPFPYPLLKIGVKASREELTPNVLTRTRQMLQNGLVDEVKSMMAKGLENWAPLSSVGYLEVLQFLNGEIVSEKELEDLIVQNTHRLAKKQRTWFQRDSEIHWVPMGDKGVAENLISQWNLPLIRP